MAQATITFQSVVQDLQDYASFEPTDDRMASRINFSLEINGKTYPNMTVEVSQSAGTNYETEYLEAGPIQGPYQGNWNHADFRDLCETYYRSMIGSQGRAIRIEGSRNVRMRNCSFARQSVVSLEIPN